MGVPKTIVLPLVLRKVCSQEQALIDFPLAAGAPGR